MIVIGSSPSMDLHPLSHYSPEFPLPLPFWSPSLKYHCINKTVAVSKCQHINRVRNVNPSLVMDCDIEYLDRLCPVPIHWPNRTQMILLLLLRLTEVISSVQPEPLSPSPLLSPALLRVLYFITTKLTTLNSPLYSLSCQKVYMKFLLISAFVAFCISKIWSILQYYAMHSSDS